MGKCVNSCAAYGKICPLSAAAAGRAARRKVETILSDSSLFQGRQPVFHTIESSEVILGEKLGEGGFCSVHACALGDAPLDESCAVKYLRRQITVNKKSFEHGAADLVTEAFFLARLDHPNIIRLRAVTAGGIETNISSGTETGFFIVIDRLVETLDQRIHRWKSHMDESPHSLFYRMSKEYKDNQKALLKERLRVAMDIASVMSYLHSLNIAYRDLKPDNIGFDREGKLKLFDLGLCKEEKPSILGENSRYQMTGHTGSRRYMAPEVAKDQHYDKSVDVYSFGLLLWEICTLIKPFEGYCSKKHMVNVIIGGERPKMDHAHTANWPESLQGLIKKCWSSHPEERPPFPSIVSKLEKIMEELSVVHPERTRARSTGSQEDHHQKSPLSQVKRLHLQGLGSLRARSLGLKRSHS